MVSISTVLTLGAIGVAVALFFGAGGFKGVGSKVGGFFGQGFSDFGASISSAFTGGLLGGSANPNTGGNTTGIGTPPQIGPDPSTGTGPFDPFGNLFGNLKGLQNILDTINNFFVGQGPAFEVNGQTFATKAFPRMISTGTEFGGFLNAQTQASALEAVLASNKAKFSEFF